MLDDIDLVKNISFVMVVYREDKYQRARACIDKAGAEDVVVIRNADSIFAAYDEGWRRAKNDVVCFLHEDVEIKQMYAALIFDYLQKPNVGFLGVAGTRYFDSSAIWWNGPTGPQAAERLSGACGHISDEKSWYNIFGPFGNVVVLDGVCLFARKETLRHIGGFQDPPLAGFDFYDISATFRAHLLGLRNYTIPIRLFHWGLGYPRESWELCRQQFLQKYGDQLPASTRLEEI